MPDGSTFLSRRPSKSSARCCLEGLTHNAVFMLNVSLLQCKRYVDGCKFDPYSSVFQNRLERKGLTNSFFERFIGSYNAWVDSMYYCFRFPRKSPAIPGYDWLVALSV